MSIIITCRQCSKRFRVDDRHAGRSTGCPACGATLQIPMSESTSPPNTRANQRNVSHPPLASSLQHSGAGIAATVIGALALFLCWVPFVSVVALVFGFLGTIIGAVAYITARANRRTALAFPIAGTSVSLLAFIIAGWMSIKTTEALDTIFGLHDGPLVALDSNTQAQPTDSDSSGDSGRGSADHWQPADQIVQHGNTTLRIMSLIVDYVPLPASLGRPAGPSGNPSLMITVQIINASDTQKIEYHTWAGLGLAFHGRARLEDNLGNNYHALHHDLGDAPVGRTLSASIYPGRAITDILVFEPPIPKATALDLILPGLNVDADEGVRIRIPTSMIDWRAS